MKKKGFLAWLILGALLLLAGILVIVHSEGFLKIVMVCTGLGAAISGISTLLSIRKIGYLGVSKNLALVKSAATVIVGLIAVFAPLFAAETVVTIVIYALALSLVFSAAVSIENAFAAKKIDKSISVIHLWAEAGLSLVIAIILFANPTAILLTAVKVIGVVAALIGAVFCYKGITVLKKEK